MTALAALLWAFPVGTGGYLFGNALRALIGKYKAKFLGAVVATMISAWAVWLFVRKKPRGLQTRGGKLQLRLTRKRERV